MSVSVLKMTFQKYNPKTIASRSYKMFDSAIRQKGESENGCHRKTMQVKLSEKQTFLTPCNTRFGVCPFALLLMKKAFLKILKCAIPLNLFYQKFHISMLLRTEKYLEHLGRMVFRSWCDKKNGKKYQIFKRKNQERLPSY